jgi:hypothetical protein
MQQLQQGNNIKATKVQKRVVNECLMKWERGKPFHGQVENAQPNAAQEHMDRERNVPIAELGIKYYKKMSSKPT